MYRRPSAAGLTTLPPPATVALRRVRSRRPYARCLSMHEAVHATAHGMRIAIPEVVTIWLVLLLLAVIALGALSLPDPRVLLVVHAVRRAARASRRRDGASGPVRRAEEATRCAEEITLAAERAAVTAERRRAEWLAGNQAVEAAWEAFNDADREVRRVVAAAAFPLPATGGSPGEYAERERNLHRIVERAYRRGELSAEQRTRALAHHDGFDPTLHPCQQEIALRRAVLAHRVRQYLAASATEREASRAADLAAAAQRSLHEEAEAAARYAERLQRRADGQAARQRGGVASGRPRVAAAN